MRSFPVRLAIRWVLVGLGAIAAVIVATPLGRYLIRAGWEEAKILSRRERIENVIADPRTSETLRGRLRLVMAARQFALDSLGLSAGESFTTCSTRPRRGLVLSAAYRDRLEAYRW
jgi:predicted aminopeptidase